MSLERFYAGLELRAEGRRLIGPAIRYGEVSRSHWERFEAGAFNLGDGRTRWLDVGHDPERVIAHSEPGGGLELRDTAQALEVAATLPRIPAADRALADVRAGKLRGFSIEFHAEAERRESGIRIVSKATLAGIGLVANPSYQGSKAEVRAGSMSGFVPFGQKVDCECHGESRSAETRRGVCDIQIEDVSFPAGRDVLATAGRLERAVASRETGSLELTKTTKGLEVAIAADILEATEAGRELAKVATVVPIYARPLFDADASKWADQGGVAVYSDMRVRGILLKPTFHNRGWPAVEFGGQRREARPEPGPRPQAVRMRRWL